MTRALEDGTATFDHFCLRCILRIPYTAHVTNADVRLRAGCPPQLLPLIQTRRLHFFGHVARMSDTQGTFRALHMSIRRLPKDWKRRSGRPHHTWLRTLNTDFHPLNHGLNSAWRLAQNRERWRQLVETATLQPGARCDDDDEKPLKKASDLHHLRCCTVVVLMVLNEYCASCGQKNKPAQTFAQPTSMSLISGTVSKKRGI